MVQFKKAEQTSAALKTDYKDLRVGRVFQDGLRMVANKSDLQSNAGLAHLRETGCPLGSIWGLKALKGESASCGRVAKDAIFITSGSELLVSMGPASRRFPRSRYWVTTTPQKLRGFCDRTVLSTKLAFGDNSNEDPLRFSPRPVARQGSPFQVVADLEGKSKMMSHRSHAGESQSKPGTIKW